MKNITKILLLFYSIITFGQTVGTPNGFGSDELAIFVSHNLYETEANDSNQAFRLLAGLNNDLYSEEVEWTSSHPDLASIDEEGIVRILMDEDQWIVFTAISEVDRGLAATISFNFSSNVPPEDIQIVGNSIIKQRTDTPIYAVLMPSGLPDFDAVFTSSDTSLAKVENRLLTGEGEGTVTITVTSSVNASLSTSLEVEVLGNPDLMPPTITINNQDEGNVLTVQKGTLTVVPQATADDNDDGELTVDITSISPPGSRSGTRATEFDGNAVGDYYYRYSVTDSQGNTNSQNIIVRVQDTIAPTLSFTDNSIESGSTITAIQGEGLEIPEVTAVDDDGTSVVVHIMDSSFDPDVIGDYHIKYEAEDAYQNVDSLTVNLVIDRGNPPTITFLNGATENDIIKVPKMTQGYILPDAEATDALGNIVTVTRDDGTLDYDTEGNYDIMYQAQDRFGETTTAKITIAVVDSSPPVITNKDEIRSLRRTLDTSTPTYVTQVNATDDFGVTQFIITEVSENEAVYGVPPRGDEHYEFLTNSGGTITISATGEIRATRAFGATFYFKIEVLDAEKNKDFTYMTLSDYDIQAPYIAVRRPAVEPEWNQIGFTETYFYATELSSTTVVDTELLHVRVSPFDYALEDMILLSTAGSDDFDFVAHPTDSNIRVIKLKNSIDTSVQDEYSLSIEIRGKRSPIDPVEVIATISIQIKFSNPAAINPCMGDLIDLVGASNLLTLRAIFLRYKLPVVNHNVLGPIDDVLDIDLAELPIVQDELTEERVKFILKFMPYAVWASKSNGILRLFVKFQKGPISVQIELVRNNNTNITSWITNLGSSIRGAGFQPSTIHSSLAFMDHLEGGILVTTGTVNKSNFDCVPLHSDLNLEAGIHLVAKGNLLPNGGGNPLLNPRVAFRLGLTEEGYTYPGLKLNMLLDPNFFDAFDKELLNYLLVAANEALAAVEEAINVVRLASDNLRQGEYALRAANATFNHLQRGIRSLQYRVNSLQRAIDRLTTFIDQDRDKIDELLENHCVDLGCVPYYLPAWCTYYPCLRYGGCFELGSVCAPNPAALAQIPFYASRIALDVGSRAGLYITIAAATAVLDAASVGIEGARIAAEEANRRVEDVLRVALIAAEQSLIGVRNGFGELGNIAQFVLNALGNLVESSNASIETTLNAANNGTFAGKLGFDFKFKGAPKVSKEINFNFTDPIGNIESFGSSLIN